MHVFDGTDDSADDFLAIVSNEGQVGAEDSGLYYGVLVADGGDEGGVGGCVAFYDFEIGEMMKFLGKFGRVSYEGRYGMVFGKTGG